MKYLAREGLSAAEKGKLVALSAQERRAELSRRSWTVVQKQTIVREAQESGDPVAVVARRHDMNANHLFMWIEHARQGTLGRRRAKSPRQTEPMDFIDLGEPVAAIASEPRGVEAEHSTDLPAAQSRDQSVETWSVDGATRRSAEIVADDLDVVKPRRLATSTSSYWRRSLSRFDCTCCGVDWRTWTTALRRNTVAGRSASCVVIAGLLCRDAACLEQQMRQRPESSLTLRRCHAPKSRVVEHEVELAC